ncbi:ubiquitin carboxyl-terminal hydrolase [Sodiomyces alkalinus F11]|uniref:ubiquitinyl hydrolase 1 n=1 Tax=Sodiomyces alkalinus (strain CBS 110278 / VKM F-3762 / F11) TaxID=1314773 RepID=A0A3N2PXI6_SODAK|nr:ubiquitin carboxyl-terminal hydrolase [Sodiomyces alkalinus F11]ROT39184.1 ubiquitin carboxyl-terminal hydrolase [Sodiomyces alkalinus F11]
MKGKRFFGVRDKDKDGSHRSSKSEDGIQKSLRAQSADAFSWLFKNDASRQSQTSVNHENEKAKVDEVLQRLDESNFSGVSPEVVRDVLQGRYASGDVAKAVELLQLSCDASAGKIYPYDPNVHMLGAENRDAVTCYLDSLLFSMFVSMTAYEGMLKHDFTDEPRSRLVTLLRLWVNMLRTGKLITADIAKHIQEALADCGWRDARNVEQQDTSEAFAFITETLQLPLLQLQVDLFHHGKTDDSDHKIVQERLLNLAVPPDPEGRGLRLEDCVDDYFNSQVDVLRDSLEDKKETPRPATASRMSTMRLVSRDDEAEMSTSEKPTASPVPISPTRDKFPAPGTPNGSLSQASPSIEFAQLSRHRSASVIQHVHVDEKGRPTESGEASRPGKARRTSSTIVKAVTIPAWQFFRLIPWHAAGNREPKNNREVAMSFDQRPVVGICLKRYRFTEQHVPQRLNTFIDIPDSLRLPYFILADERHLEEDPNGFSREYKLVLQSVICHRGESVHSGHYITFARVAPRLLTHNRRHNFDPPPDYEEAQWVKFDDLQLDNRVSYVDDFKQALKAEMPYLLFYQIVPMVDVATTEETETELPSYADSNSKASFCTSAAPSLAASAPVGTVGSMYGAEVDGLDPRRISPPQAPSVRLSLDMERLRLDNHTTERLNSTDLNTSDSLLTFPTKTSDSTSSAGVTPVASQGEESTRDRLSRAAAIFTGKTKSRPPSQGGEGRISSTMIRLGGLIRAGKEPQRDTGVQSPSANDPTTPTSARPGDLSVRASTEASRPSFESDLVVELPSENDADVPNMTPRKDRQKRNKARFRGTQPERECNLM